MFVRNIIKNISKLNYFSATAHSKPVRMQLFASLHNRIRTGGGFANALHSSEASLIVSFLFFTASNICILSCSLELISKLPFILISFFFFGILICLFYWHFYRVICMTFLKSYNNHFLKQAICLTYRIDNCIFVNCNNKKY